MESPSVELTKKWLVENGFTADFEKRLMADPDCSLVAPENMHRLMAFLEETIGRNIIVPPLLLTIDDWALYLKTEMDMVMRLRASANERRILIDQRYHIFNQSEIHLASGMFALTVSFKWKSKIYAAGSRFAMYNWEGDYLDCVCDAPGCRAKLEALSEEFRLSRQSSN